MRPFRSLLGRKPSAAPATAPAERAARDLPRPDKATYLVGDLHGRADLLELMLELIDAHIAGNGSADPQLVFLGDYIDRGPGSAQVLDRLIELTRDLPDNVTCIMGCHERMLLDVLADPALRGPRWLRHGGAATLKSLGVATDGLEPGSPAEAFRAMADRLRAALGPERVAWITALPLSWSSGNLWAVHAGADPLRDMADQSARVLIWGHPEFDTTARGDGLWIAHGHTERAEALIRDQRLALDTAAHRSGKLTCCAVRPNGRHDLLQT